MKTKTTFLTLILSITLLTITVVHALSYDFGALKIRDIYLRDDSTVVIKFDWYGTPDYPYLCLLYTSPSPRDLSTSRMPSSA